jgi:hypothetical protein
MVFLRSSIRIGIVLCVCLLLACASKPPVPTGSVSGIAVDTAGHGLPGITVTIQSEAGKAVETVLTASDGSYSFAAIPAGNYRVLTFFAGFTAPSPLPATVTAGQAARLQPLVLVPPGDPAAPASR